jgi:hypothetical protein
MKPHLLSLSVSKYNRSFALSSSYYLSTREAEGSSLQEKVDRQRANDEDITMPSWREVFLDFLFLLL